VGLKVASEVVCGSESPEEKKEEKEEQDALNAGFVCAACMINIYIYNMI